MTWCIFERSVQSLLQAWVATLPHLQTQVVAHPHLQAQVVVFPHLQMQATLYFTHREKKKKTNCLLILGTLFSVGMTTLVRTLEATPQTDTKISESCGISLTEDI